MNDMKQKNMQKAKQSQIRMLFETSLPFFPSEEVKEKGGDLNCQKKGPINFGPGCKCLLLLRTQRENTIRGLTLKHSPECFGWVRKAYATIRNLINSMNFYL